MQQQHQLTISLGNYNVFSLWKLHIWLQMPLVVQEHVLWLPCRVLHTSAEQICDDRLPLQQKIPLTD